MTPQQKATVKILNGEVKARIIEDSIKHLWDGTGKIAREQRYSIESCLRKTQMLWPILVKYECTSIAEHILKCLAPHKSYTSWAVANNLYKYGWPMQELQWNKANWMRELARQYRAGEIG